MIKIKRQDLINYIKDNIDTSLDFIDVELNLDTRDERLDGTILVFPYIENEMGYNLQKSFITLSKTIREEEAFLDDYVTEIIVEECVYDNENHPKKIR